MVTEILELSGVDFHTGNIRYPGDVLLKGEVCDGFTLSCGGDLYSSEPLNVTAIQVKGDLKVEGGIIGRTPGTLKVGGTVQARFIENLELECRGDLIVEGGILHSRIHTLGKVVCGEKGKIFNSDIHAVEGLEAKQLGNPAGQLTQIHCGCDFREVKRYRAIKEQEKQFLARLQEKKTASRNSAMSDEEALELRRELHELAERAEEAMGRMDIRPEAHVMVRDTIYPGVSIEICRVLYRVDKSIPRGTFFLDTESREIRVSDS